MSRQLELDKEVAESKRRDTLVRALEYELAGLLQMSDIMMHGFAVKYDDFECLMTLKADVQGIRSVAFVASDGVIGCVLKAVQMVKYDRLRWKEDVYKIKPT